MIIYLKTSSFRGSNPDEPPGDHIGTSSPKRGCFQNTEQSMESCLTGKTWAWRTGGRDTFSSVSQTNKSTPRNVSGHRSPHSSLAARPIRYRRPAIDGGDAHRVFLSFLGVAAGPQAPIHTELVNQDFKRHKL